MASSTITIAYTAEKDFDEQVLQITLLIQKVISVTMNMREAVVERVSFVNYHAKTIHSGFPINQPLAIHNTSTLDNFGFGRYTGNFFDVLIRIYGNPMNLRIFYASVASPPLPTAQPVPVAKRGRRKAGA